MPPSQEIGQSEDNSVLGNDNKLEQPSQVKTENVTALDLASTSPPEDFNPGWRFYASFISLCIITIAVALDATSLSVALPVTAPLHSSIILADHSIISHRPRSLRPHGPGWRGLHID